MDKYLKAHIEHLLCVGILNTTSISGGDISQAYLLEAEKGQFFCKVNHNVDSFEMFMAEKAGLDAISRTKTIAVPKVLFCEPLEKGGFLLMEFIPSKRASSADLELLGHQLGALHQATESEAFGWNDNNFIGRLAQKNTKDTNWYLFYAKQRLLPQLRLAQESGWLDSRKIPSEENLVKTCQNLFPETNPCLLHGDLWSGNYLIAQNRIPYLIDPAIYYGHHEVDISMTKLFGGFGAPFYQAYEEHFPKIGGEAERTELYQLYYLLVHLNLFGRSYLGQVQSILKKFF